MKLDEALTFDDVLIRPGYSSILPREVSTSTYFSRDIKINSADSPSTNLDLKFKFPFSDKVPLAATNRLLDSRFERS